MDVLALVLDARTVMQSACARVFFVSEDGAGFMTGNRPDHALPVDSLADLLEQTEPGDVIQISGTIENLRLDGGKRK